MQLILPFSILVIICRNNNDNWINTQEQVWIKVQIITGILKVILIILVKWYHAGRHHRMNDGIWFLNLLIFPRHSFSHGSRHVLFASFSGIFTDWSNTYVGHSTNISLYDILYLSDCNLDRRHLHNFYFRHFYPFPLSTIILVIILLFYLRR